MAQGAGASTRILPNETWDRVQGVLTNASATIIGPVPAGGTWKVLSLTFTEKSVAARTVTVRDIKSGGADDNTSDFVQAMDLAAKEMVRLEGGGKDDPLIVLTGGDKINALASANTAVNYAAVIVKER